MIQPAPRSSSADHRPQRRALCRRAGSSDHAPAGRSRAIIFAARQAWVICVVTLVCLGANSSSGADLSEARKQFFTGHYTECRRACEQALREDEYSEDWRLLLIQSCLTQGRYAEAHTALSSALARFQNS